MTLVAPPPGLTCPHCTSTDLRALQLDDAGEIIVVCFGCSAAFEPETRADPCRQLCNNCAFRPDSNERQDPWAWLFLMEQLFETPGARPFHCHKGLKLELQEDRSAYRFLQPEGGLADMTPCAGWRSRRAAHAAGVPLHKL